MSSRTVTPCPVCSKEAKITRTRHNQDGSINRRRTCEDGHAHTTYERPFGEGLNVHEQRLVNLYRRITKKQKGLLWAIVNEAFGE